MVLPNFNKFQRIETSQSNLSDFALIFENQLIFDTKVNPINIPQGKEMITPPKRSLTDTTALHISHHLYIALVYLTSPRLNSPYKTGSVHYSCNPYADARRSKWKIGIAEYN
ncbi:hypothetical protein AVEN_219645-1 [Araneus ventricosus]|uniref:Uncharacterized protein n=1 Tax=Araneus ventricosus TaxID=182803 RepID=A0A4Y2KS54_ARAVE|nr:hypothetical protein AVEN_219645-1 [Araneus ventricosus]